MSYNKIVKYLHIETKTIKVRYNKMKKLISIILSVAMAKETIECLWDNLDDPSKCENNPYYYGNAEKYEL